MDKKMFNIDKNVKIPEKLSAGRKPKYPFGSMEVGDSFLCDEHTVYSSASWFGKRNGKRFSVQKVDRNLFRCFRVE